MVPKGKGDGPGLGELARGQGEGTRAGQREAPALDTHHEFDQVVGGWLGVVQSQAAGGHAAVRTGDLDIDGIERCAGDLDLHVGRIRKLGQAPEGTGVLIDQGRLAAERADGAAGPHDGRAFPGIVDREQVLGCQR